MAFSTPVNLDTHFDVTNDNTELIPTSGTVSLVAGRLYVLFYATHRTGGPPDLSATSITGQAGSWTFIAQSGSYAVGLRAIGAFYYVATATENVQLTVDPPGAACSNHQVALIEIASGFDDADPIGLSAVNAVDASTDDFPVNLASAPAGSSLSLVGVANEDETAGINPDANFAEGGEAQGSGTAADSGCIQWQYADPARQTCASARAGGNDKNWGGVHVEILAGSVALSGSGALSVPAPNIAASGVLAFIGSAALAVTAPALSATGAQEFTGSAAVTVPAPAIDSSGLLEFTGTGALGVTVSVAGTGTTEAAAISGSGALTVPAPGVDATGALEFTGSATLTVPTPAVESSGLETFAGSGALTANASVDGDGFINVPIEGVGALTVPAPSVSGSGTQEFAGSSALTVPVPSVAASGTQEFAGSASLAVTAPSVAASGTYTPLALSGSGALTVTVSVSGSGETEIPPFPETWLRQTQTGSQEGEVVSRAVGRQEIERGVL